jgi:hypothetical protein
VKYGAEGRFMFNRVNRFTVGAGTRRDILQLGVQLTMMMTELWQERLLLQRFLQEEKMLL